MTTFFDYFFGAGLAIVALAILAVILIVLHSVIVELIRSKEWQAYAAVGFVIWIVMGAVYFLAVR